MKINRDDQDVPVARYWRCGIETFRVDLKKYAGVPSARLPASLGTHHRCPTPQKKKRLVTSLKSKTRSYYIKIKILIPTKNCSGIHRGSLANYRDVTTTEILIQGGCHCCGGGAERD